MVIFFEKLKLLFSRIVDPLEKHENPPQTTPPEIQEPWDHAQMIEPGLPGPGLNATKGKQKQANAQNASKSKQIRGKLEAATGATAPRPRLLGPTFRDPGN